MNNWLKAGIVITACVLIYFVGFEQMQLYKAEVAFVLIALAVVAVLLFDKVNWGLLFKKERETMTLDEWVPKAKAALIKNSPESFRGGQRVEGEIIQSVPVGVLWVYIPHLNYKKCAFGEVWKDSANFIASPLDTIENHLRTTFSKSKAEVGLAYLRKADIEPLSLWKKTKNAKEVVE